MPPAPVLLALPFLYPLAGIAFVLTHPPLLVSVLLKAAVCTLVPLYWYSASLRARAAASIYGRALAARGVAPAQLTAAERARLAAVAVPRGGGQPRGGAGSTVRRVLVTAFTPAAPGWSLPARWAKNAVVGPLNAAFPAGRALAMMSDPADAAVTAMAPYWAAKGVSPHGPEVAALARAHGWQLRAFGVVAAVLSAVPVVSQVTQLTTAAGAALFAADLERAGGLVA